ncbi:MAG: molybdopterin molybdotransferase MoeA [Planctomycetota bacterium]
MTPKDEALRILFAAIPEVVGDGESVALDEALGRVLAEDVAADMDQPPFDRASMDGFAVRAADLAAGAAELAVVGTVAAGEVADFEVGPGACARIMTGAPMPAGADAVVMVERSRDLGGDRVALEDETRAGANVAPRGQDVREGEVVLRRGTPLRPVEIGVLASVGRDRVRVFPRPRVAVVATGDELVPPGAGRPGPGQIRESNAHMLAAQVAALGEGIRAERLGIARDTREDVDAFLDRGLAADVLILSGGVSMGDYDFVHVALKERGLAVKLERVAIKPGKPLLFGSLDVEGRRVFVFGLPGNPVSSFVTFELFVRPFLRGLTGRAATPLEIRVRVAADCAGRAMPRTQHLPAVLESTDEGLGVRALEWHGSGDLRGLADANAFVVVPTGEAPPAAGEMATVLVIESEALRRSPRASRG